MWINAFWRLIYYLFIYLFELVADPQSLLEEKEALEEKLAIRDYENRLAQEDILKLKTELQKKSEAKQDEPSGKMLNSSSIFIQFYGFSCLCVKYLYVVLQMLFKYKNPWSFYSITISHFPNE